MGGLPAGGCMGPRGGGGMGPRSRQWHHARRSTVRLYTPTHLRSCCIHAKGRASAFAAVAADAVQGAYEIVHLIREEHLLEGAE